MTHLTSTLPLPKFLHVPDGRRAGCHTIPAMSEVDSQHDKSTDVNELTDNESIRSDVTATEHQSPRASDGMWEVGMGHSVYSIQKVSFFGSKMASKYVLDD